MTFYSMAEAKFSIIDNGRLSLILVYLPKK